MSDNHAIYEKEYLPFIIKWGRITNGAGLLLCFSPALVLASSSDSCLRLRPFSAAFWPSRVPLEWFDLWGPFPIS